MSENIVAETWMTERIAAAQVAAKAADASYTILRIHNEEGDQVDPTQAPPSGEPPYYPCIMLRLRTPLEDSRGISGTTMMTNLIYLVEVIGRESSFSAISPVVRMINTAIHQQKGPAAGGLVLACIRLKLFKLPDFDKGVRYQRLGYEYELSVSL